MARMKKMVKCFLGLLVLALSLTARAQGGNLVSNAGFESGFTNWNVSDASKITIDSTIQHGGTQSARLSGLNSDNGWKILDYQSLPVQAGCTYEIKAWMKIQNATLGHPKIQCGSDVYYLMGGAQGTGTWDWQLITGSYTVPAGESALYFRVWMWGSNDNDANPGYVWIDDVSITRLPLASGGTSTYTIRLCENPIPAETKAANELQNFLQQITGATLPIQQAGGVPANAILVGRDAECDNLVPGVDWATLGGEGFVVATVGDRLVLAGGRPRGTLYAVYSFLQEELGCRWFTPDASLIPEQDPLIIESINRIFIPAFEYREPMSWPLFHDPIWGVRNFLNRNAGLGDEWGNGVTYAGFVHTYYELLPPSPAWGGNYFTEHPEWYSWRPEGSEGYGLGTEGVDYVREVNGGIQGERYWKNEVTGLPGQLCLTNPAVVTVMTEKVRDRLRATPSVDIISVSHNDGYGNCQCANCKASDTYEGNYSGTQVNFVNQIADNIKDEFPKVGVDMLAYSLDINAPLHARPRPNVIIRFCGMAPGIVCHLHEYKTVLYPETYPDGGCNYNFGFAEWIKDWQKVLWGDPLPVPLLPIPPDSPRLYVWDYIPTYANPLVPYPDLNVLEPNIKFFRELGVKGVFLELDGYRAGTEFEELRAYVLAQLLWNPDYNGLNPNRARDEFIDFYYGPAKEKIKDYLTLIEGNFPGFAWDPTHKLNVNWESSWNAGGYLAPGILSKSWELFDEAEALAAADTSPDRENYRKRVRTARLPLQYVVLRRGPDGGWWTTGGGQWGPPTGLQTSKRNPTPVSSYPSVGTSYVENDADVPWTSQELAGQFLAGAAEEGFDWTRTSDTFPNELITQYAIDHKIIFLEAPTGDANPIIRDGTVQCTVLAQYIFDKSHYAYLPVPTPPVTYAWSVPEGRFEDTGTKTSTLQNPRWIADVTIPDTAAGISVQISVTASCGVETPSTASYLEWVQQTNTHTITASTGAYGTISPLGIVVVGYGNTQAFTITPDSGYWLSTLLVDGVLQDTQFGQRAGYTFSSVIANHTIAVTFRSIPTYTITAQAQAGNLVSNPGFESGLTDWTGWPEGNITIDSTVAHSGTKSARLSGLNSENGWKGLDYQSIPVQAGCTYEIKAWMKIQNATAGHIKVQCGSDVYYLMNGAQGTGTWDWQLISGSYTVPAGESALYFRVWMWGSNDGDANPGYVWIDDASITLAPPHGAVSPASQDILYGGAASINIIPDANYCIATITDNWSLATIASPYVINNVTTAHTVVVTFALDTYSVSASVSGGNGTVSPLSHNISSGGTATINISPNVNYCIAVITDNGVLKTVANPYVITNVTAAHSVVVTFGAPTMSITSPAEGTVIVGNSVTINADASDSYETITKVVFSEDGTAIDTDTATPYSIVWNNAPAGAHVLTTKAYGSGGGVTTSAAVNITIWNTADINASGGSASYSSGVFTVAGKGAGITGTADGFRFVYTQITGDCTITARITAVTGTTYTNSRSGVMIRQDTTGGAKEASSLFYKPSSAKRYYFHQRTTTGGSTSTSYTSANTATPWWMKVVRTGNTLQAYKSTNGTSWTQVGSNTTVTMTNPVQVGLAVTSGNTSNANTVTIDSVTISAGQKSAGQKKLMK